MPAPQFTSEQIRVCMVRISHTIPFTVSEDSHGIPSFSVITGDKTRLSPSELTDTILSYPIKIMTLSTTETEKVFRQKFIMIVA